MVAYDNVKEQDAGSTLNKNDVKENIFLFAPNIIGYFRVFLALTALVIAFQSWPWMCFCYFISQILDAADGFVARRYHQATIFGAVLDQVTDRLSTVGILLLDSVVLPRYYLLFAIVLILDLGGHWVHTFASMLAGSESHKKIPTTWPLLKLYYENKTLMFICHASNEFVWISLFVLTRATTSSLISTLIKLLLVPTLVFCILKNVTNILQMVLGAQVLAFIDIEKRSEKKKGGRQD